MLVSKGGWVLHHATQKEKPFFNIIKRSPCTLLKVFKRQVKAIELQDDKALGSIQTNFIIKKPILQDKRKLIEDYLIFI